MKEDKNNTKIGSLLQVILNISLILLSLALCGLLVKEVFYIFQTLVGSSEKESYYIFLEKILIFFMYFEFIMLIIKYFQEDYHFPIRYFLYIGITALIRLIVVQHDNPVSTFWYTLSILVLIIGFLLVQFIKRDKE